MNNPREHEDLQKIGKSLEKIHKEIKRTNDILELMLKVKLVPVVDEKWIKEWGEKDVR